MILVSITVKYLSLKFELNLLLFLNKYTEDAVAVSLMNGMT